jgi:hypothetical protein
VSLRVEMDPDWREKILAAWDLVADEKLGAPIAGDARRYAPKRTGALADSVEHHIEGHTVVVSATGGDDGRTYAAYVELGHRVYHPSTGETGPEVVAPQPFLRPALYQERG